MSELKREPPRSDKIFLKCVSNKYRLNATARRAVAAARLARVVALATV
ncbi:MAG: hypothetical protein HKN35_09260 [Woeseia sp.]|nr:hypothetical protein [Woeseia sp.]MBT8095925.1 hypothetical protein [Woeseia sp.]NNE61071.1 hypothetical protein [Woeseia sp.]NNL53751.1 hypothetical protein [Woeseia sp.]